jgi:spermidine synthase
MDITPTRHGLRLSQHGVVISELRVSPGPTQSVWDVLSALVIVLAPRGRVGVLGFAGGGMMAPWHGLGGAAQLEAVDLDRASYELFCQHCPTWITSVRWQQDDAAAWLQRQPADFDLVLEDLSLPVGGDVLKPDVTWAGLPELIRQRLRPGGRAVFNLLRPASDRWQPEFDRLAGGFKNALVIHLRDFENRLVVAGTDLPSARQLSVRLKRALDQLRSRQASRLHVRTWRPARQTSPRAARTLSEGT